MESVIYLEKNMKRILAALLLLAVVGTANAQWHHPHGHFGYRGGYYGGGWVAPVIIGGVIGYELSRPVVVQQQPVIVHNPPTVVYQSQPNCTLWTETQNSDGTITRTRTCSQ